MRIYLLLILVTACGKRDSKPEQAERQKVEQIAFPEGIAPIRDTDCEPNSLRKRTHVGRPGGEARRVAAFSIDRTAATCEDYQQCIDAGGCFRVDVGLCKGDVLVSSAEDAVSYCNWRGMQLPTWEQWQRAARLSDGRRYPDGASPRTNWCPDVGGKRQRCPIENEAGFIYAVQNPNTVEWTSDWDCSLTVEDAMSSAPPSPISTSHIARVAVDLFGQELDDHSMDFPLGEFRCATSK